LIFTCCHPALLPDARVALTLRTICGLTTDEIARAFLTTGPTIAQRIVRAKQKIREARIPYRVPDALDVPERLSSVLTCIYLVFTEGYAASAGDTLVRRELCREAIRLARLVHEMMPEQSEVSALLALMLLHDSRGAARTNPDGDVVLITEQDRTRWDRAQISEGLSLVDRSLRAGPAGPYAVQAAIAALHVQPLRASDTDWPQILALYDLLRRLAPSPVVELNRAVAVLRVRGAQEALSIVDEIAAGGALESYHLLPATRAHLLRELGRFAEAARCYRQAVNLAGVEQERRFLRRRLAECEARESKSSADKDGASNNSASSDSAGNDSAGKNSEKRERRERRD
jgi:RNA polymerase sigma-70 factor (ECF subfamily)